MLYYLGDRGLPGERGAPGPLNEVVGEKGDIGLPGAPGLPGLQVCY